MLLVCFNPIPASVKLELPDMKYLFLSSDSDGLNKKHLAWQKFGSSVFAITWSCLRNKTASCESLFNFNAASIVIFSLRRSSGLSFSTSTLTISPSIKR